MSNFISHEPCPKCGSRDNLGVYDDGHKFCFGCKYYEPGEHKQYSKSVLKRLKTQIYWQLPTDASPVIGDLGFQWLKKYDITSDIAFRYNFMWANSRLLLLFPLYMGRRYVGHQARGFGQTEGPKYVTRIDPEVADKYFYIQQGELFPNTVVLVEDIISAVKVNLAGYTSIALMGSFLRPQIRDYILTLNKDTYIIPWLDPDKYQENVNICNEMELYGYPTKYIHTADHDPKDYPIKDLQKIVDNRVSYINATAYWQSKRTTSIEHTPE